MTQIPRFALSVRQPWAWAIVHGGKDIENRSPAAIRNLGPVKGRIAIHASKGMTRGEYVEACEFMRSIGVMCPPAGGLLRAGIIGSVRVVETVKESRSPWFFGPRGLVLADPEPCEFVPSVGVLGCFTWSAADPSIVPPLARWMRPICFGIDLASEESPPQGALL